MRTVGGAAPADDPMATPIIRFGNQTFQPLASGALHWPAERALLVADLHLEKMSSFARRGSFLPPYDTGLTLKRLAADRRIRRRLPPRRAGAAGGVAGSFRAVGFV